IPVITFSHFSSSIRFLWVALLIINPCSNAIAAMTFANYILEAILSNCTEPSPNAVRLIAAAVIRKFAPTHHYYLYTALHPYLPHLSSCLSEQLVFGKNHSSSRDLEAKGAPLLCNHTKWF